MIQDAGGRWGPGGPTRWDRIAWRARKAVSSYWTVGAVGAAVAALHLTWLEHTSHGGEVVSGFGASVVVLGVWVAGFPVIRRGLPRAGPPTPTYLDRVLPEFRGFASRIMAEQERYKLRRDQIDERVVGVALALIGTLLNGYGTLLARLAGWEH